MFGKLTNVRILKISIILTTVILIEKNILQFTSHQSKREILLRVSGNSTAEYTPLGSDQAGLAPSGPSLTGLSLAVEPSRLFPMNQSFPDCVVLNVTLGPLWQRMGYKDFRSWQLAIKKPGVQMKDKEPWRQNTEMGGVHKPKNCHSKNKVAIVITYRDREEHLRIFLSVINPFLQRQKIDYQIFVVEQGGDLAKAFNKGKLYNVGFMKARSIRPDIDCFFFHDIDLIPEDERILYRCDDEGPKHFGAYVDTLRYRMDYGMMLGGVVATTKTQYESMNGFSNLFWAWGGEDDDFAKRAVAAGFPLKREPVTNHLFHYTMLFHQKSKEPYSKREPKRSRLIHGAARRFKSDGLNTLSIAGYSIEREEVERDFVRIVVDVKDEEP